ncbi:uncharacterized protein LOC135846308 [Planococcus citri]|uniref:uncharacterized protein LOC135846308 n=1 Tax=Planococcus citri TaxID=170843 RepID=UPI0031F94631
MEINNDLLSTILSGDSSSSSKLVILDWNVEKNIIALGNNSSSELSRLTVEYQKKGKTFKKSFILKIPSAHPMYDIGTQWKMYEKEYPMYTEVLEEMYKLDGEHIGAKLYYTDDKHSLVMKDLSSSGYKMVDRIKQLDFHQCYTVLKSLAKFHALSVKLDQHSKISPAIKRPAWPGDAVLEGQLKMHLNYSCVEFAKIIDPEFGLYEKVLRMKDDLCDRIREEVISDQFKFKVLNHGDCWLGNMLFKFDKYGNVAKVKLIDYQYSSWASPAFDILCFTMGSMQFEVFEKHFDVLMETYIEALNNTLKFYQCGSYSLQELNRDMDNLRATAILIMCSHLPQILSSHEEPIDYQRFVNNGNVDIEYYGTFFKNEIYSKVVNQWISYYVKKGLFD